MKKMESVWIVISLFCGVLLSKPVWARDSANPLWTVRLAGVCEGGKIKSLQFEAFPRGWDISFAEPTQPTDRVNLPLSTQRSSFEVGLQGLTVLLRESPDQNFFQLGEVDLGSAKDAAAVCQQTGNGPFPYPYTFDFTVTPSSNLTATAEAHLITSFFGGSCSYNSASGQYAAAAKYQLEISTSNNGKHVFSFESGHGFKNEQTCESWIPPFSAGN